MENSEFQKLVLTEILELRRDNDKKIEEVKKEQKEFKENMERKLEERDAQAREDRVALDLKLTQIQEGIAKENHLLREQNLALQNRQTAFDNRQNEFDHRLNIQGELINLTIAQLNALREKMDNLGKEAARDIPLVEIVPEPGPEEEEFLRGLLDGKVPEWDEELKNTHRETLSGLAKMGMDAGVRMFNHGQVIKKEQINKLKLNPDDHTSLMKLFIDSFGTELFAPITSSSDPRVLAIELGLKGIVLGAKFCYVLHKDIVRKKHLKKFWDDQAEKYKADIRGLLKDSSGEYFDTMLKEYEWNYYSHYDRNDTTTIRYHRTPIEGTLTPRCMRTFEKIPNYDQRIANDSNVAYKVGMFNRCYKVKFNPEEYLKDSATNEEKNEFKWKFRLYRAIKAKGEFENQSRCGDSSLLPNIIFGTLVPPYGVLCMVTRLASEVEWNDNKKRLRNILRECIIGYSDEILKKVIEYMEILTRIKHYVDVTQSKFAKKFYDKCYKNKYKHVLEDKQDLFDTAFDLYQKLENLGIANKDNYLKYPTTINLVKAEDISIDKFVKCTLDKAKDVLKNTPPQIAETREIMTTTTTDKDGNRTVKIEEKYNHKRHTSKRFKFSYQSNY